MYKKMLVLLDGSKMSEVVFSYARELAGRLGLDLYLLHVCTAVEAEQLPMRKAYIEHMAEQLLQESEAVRNKAGASARGPLQATGTVVVGYPAEEILKYAADNDVDLIMLSTHGRSGIRRWGLGSVADKVVHETDIPVWLVPAHLHEGIIHDTLPQLRLLVPMDGSKTAETVIPHVINLTRQRGVETEILLINVTPVIPPRYSPRENELIKENLALLKTQGEVYLKEIVDRFREAGIKATPEQLAGDPAEEIVKYAARYNPRLIIMATHGRSGFKRFVFGSTAESVLRRLQRTPMLLIKAEE